MVCCCACPTPLTLLWKVMESLSLGVVSYLAIIWNGYNFDWIECGASMRTAGQCSRKIGDGSINVAPIKNQTVGTTHTLRAAPLVLSIWPCKRISDEEKWKHAGLAQQTGCGPEFFAENFLLNGYSPGELLLVGSHLFALLDLWVELERLKITKLGCEKYFDLAERALLDMLASKLYLRQTRHLTKYVSTRLSILWRS
jgi:hypothetical protein